MPLLSGGLISEKVSEALVLPWPDWGLALVYNTPPTQSLHSGSPHFTQTLGGLHTQKFQGWAEPTPGQWGQGQLPQLSIQWWPREKGGGIKSDPHPSLLTVA